MFRPIAVELSRAIAARSSLPGSRTPSSLVLPTAGVTVSLPAGGAGWRVVPGTAGVDRLERIAPTSPRLAVV